MERLIDRIVWPSRHLGLQTRPICEKGVQTFLLKPNPAKSWIDKVLKKEALFKIE